MITRFTRIVIEKVKVPERNLNAELMWLSKSLGLVSDRDKDFSCFRLFIEIIKAAKRQEALTSDELAFRLNLTRGTVIHHLTKLIGAGLIRVEDNKYTLRERNLELTLKKMKHDVLSTYEELENLGKKIDKKLGF